MLRVRGRKARTPPKFPSGGTIDRDERTGGARTLPVQPAREELLPSRSRLRPIRGEDFSQPPFRGQDPVQFASGRARPSPKKKVRRQSPPYARWPGTRRGGPRFAGGGNAQTLKAALRSKRLGEVIARAQAAWPRPAFFTPQNPVITTTPVFSENAPSRNISSASPSGRCRSTSAKSKRTSRRTRRASANRRRFGDLRLERAQMGRQASPQRRVIFQQEHFATGGIDSFFGDHTG